MEGQKTFNDIIKEENLDELMKAVRKICNHKLKANNIKLPAYLDKEDIIQDASYKVYCAYKKFDPSKASANTYFTRIIERVIIDYIRISNKYSNQIFAQNGTPLSDDLASELYNVVTGNLSFDAASCISIQKDIQEFLKNNSGNDNFIVDLFTDLKELLSEREMQILKLRYAGYNHEEIAEKLGVSRPTIAKDWLRIRKIIIDLI